MSTETTTTVTPAQEMRAAAAKLRDCIGAFPAALFSSEVAEPLAVWLESESDLAEYATERGYKISPESQAALAVARAINGQTAPADQAESEADRLQAQRDALLELHAYDELIFGGFICTHCTPDDADDPDDNVAWPCPSLRAVGVTDEEAVERIKAHRAAVEAKARVALT